MLDNFTCSPNRQKILHWMVLNRITYKPINKAVLLNISPEGEMLISVRRGSKTQILYIENHNKTTFASSYDSHRNYTRH